MTSWLGIARFGLVQAALGAIVVLTTSTINRVMIVELALPAMVPGLLVTWHYALQVLRPSWGHGSDKGGRRTPWIIAGMAALALGGFGAALSVHVMALNMLAGMAVAVAAFTLIGAGVGAAGTSLLVLLASQVAEARRPAAATIVWIMMIAGFIVTAALAGHFLDPFSTRRLLAVAACICAGAFALTLLAVRGLETARPAPRRDEAKVPFRAALSEVWADRTARRFAIFIFVSMLAYSAQDLILEPFAGLVFGLTPGQSTALSGVQNSGVLLGMVLVGAASTLLPRLMSLRSWTVAGCIGSALALALLVMAARVGPGWPLKPSVFALGFCNGVFAVAAIGSMFNMASNGTSREGVRMGLFGAAQAIAFGIGGFAGTVLADVSRLAFGSPVMAYATVFAVEACFFIAAALLAAAIGNRDGFGAAANPLVLAARHQASGS
ncbi:MFS transporter [Aestuariivirga litoralis]|uniref:MFS transporter n=1 Tax=Aestuariivirga litoralis TaxID=2650924 RepID=A0A2W2B7L4_9HYPH|nr:BCD family MFS transporter [Aestuariivirga litoralis]PZF76068.1 MFS transporter [Aestuariivirga litoralis]